MTFILAVVSSCGEIESAEIFEKKDDLTEELSCLVAELVADGTDFEDALDGLDVYQQVNFDEEFRKTIRKEVDLEVPLVIKRQRDQAFKEVDRLMEMTRLA